METRQKLVKTIDSIIFDLDGTLWDSNEACANAWNRVARRNNITFREVTADDLRSVTGLPHAECIRKVFLGVSERELRILIEGTEIEDIIAVAEYGGILYPGVDDGLRKLSQKYPLFIVSNCQSGYIETFLKQHKFKDVFKDFECWGNTGKSKGENLSNLVLRNGLKHPVFVGDTNGDQRAAEENQIPFWFVSYGFGKCTNAQMRFDTFEQLTKGAHRYSLTHDADPAPQKITIRKAIEADIDRIVCLSNDGGPDGKPRQTLPEALPEGYYEAFRKISLSPSHYLMVAEIDSVVVGTFHVVYIPYLAGQGREDCQIEAVHVDSEWRNRGVGTTMMRSVIDEARKRNCRRIQLTTNKIRKDAHRFYERLGFHLSHEGAKLPLEVRPHA